jgi:hypothetical protein
VVLVIAVVTRKVLRVHVQNTALSNRLVASCQTKEA